MKHIFTAIILCIAGLILRAQTSNNFHFNKTDFSPLPGEVKDNFEKSQSTGAIINWSSTLNRQPDGSYYFKMVTPVTFTCFGLGWNATGDEYPVSAFIIKYRARIKGQPWGQWYENEGYVNKDETPTHLSWTDLLFPGNENPHHELEFYLIPPQGADISYVRLSLMDMTGTGEPVKSQSNSNGNVKGTQECPVLPAIIPRSQWCGSYTACHNTSSYTNITPTHTVVHHGASPDTYTDGATIVRGYWNYHVNTLGWADIGYNYLFDKLGNMYQGRHNPNMPNTDVRGAHAGSANDGSIGLNFLGNADVTLPTTVQLDKLKAFLAWWYDHKGFDPTSSAGMTTQAYGWQVKPRILGHLDVGQTSCPGTTLYGYLPSIRTGTKTIIDNCGTTTPTGPANLQVAVSSCPNMGFTFTWTNSGTGWYIQLSPASDYSNPYQKWVSGLTTYTGPAGFVLQSNGTTPLTVTPGTTYYWRIWDGTTFTVGPSFTVPYCDTIPPSTTIATTGNWKTQDFTATFTDVDNTGGSGVSKKYYQVLDYDGTYWRANAQRGFFADNFDDLSPAVWTVPSGGGTWSVSNGSLVQSDEAINNTNIYSALDQTLSNRYLYHFTAKVEGAVNTNGRRFGFHYFCDDGSLTNRGNSYFIWFRIETNKLEFYKVTNDVFTMVDEIDDIVTTIGTVYDFKVIYDRITGDHYVYRDNILIGSWKDTSPLSTNGNYISFRSGNSKLTVNDIKVYRTRTNTANITLGNNPTKDIRYQNPSPTVSSSKIKSVAIDTAGNISAVAYHDLNVDWTNPADIGYIYDGTGADIDTTSSYTDLSANWNTSSDTQSGIADYWYAIGTAPGDSNTVGWTNAGLDTAITHTGLNLTFNMVYYVSVKARNNAGLFGNVKTSNGQVVYNTSSTLAANFIAHATSICEGDSIFFSNQSNGATSYDWVFQGGNPATSNQPNPVVVYNTAGTYGVELRVYDNSGNADTLSLNQYIVVNAKPVAAFSVVDSVVYLPAANAYFVNQSAQALNYYWSFGDSYVSTDANPWHQYTATGYYTVQLIAANNLCRNDTVVKANFIHVLDASTIGEQESTFGVNILNNSVRGQFTVQLVTTRPTELRIEMTDVLGRSLKQYDMKPYDAGTHEIEMKPDSRPASGIYYLTVTTGKGERIVRKVMIP